MEKTNRLYLNRGWKYSDSFSMDMAMADYDDQNMEEVVIPHTVAETPYNYFQDEIYQKVSAYRREVDIPKEWEGKKLLLTFEGVAHEATILVNGMNIGTHKSGYTSFTYDISNFVKPGEKAIIAVKCDSREELNQPPFGFVIDYMTYGGIYRDVYLEVKEPTFIQDVFIKTRLAGKYSEFGIDRVETGQTESEITIAGDLEGLIIQQSIRMKGEESFKQLSSRDAKGDIETSKPNEDFLLAIGNPKGNYSLITAYGQIENAYLWDLDNPVLYELKTELIRDNQVLDSRIDVFGFRRAEFKVNGFFLNGKRVKLRGLNRHQSYPYVGYAMPDSMQILDADILKNELATNVVRTSHYPQAQSFIDRCDEIGLLVFTEFPGWQHIGEGEWKDIAIQNIREMVQQYRNHPSIIIWGTRINESPDDDEFYEKTNATAKALDTTRATGGVRNFKKSKLFDDVYTYNDFVHDGTNVGVEPKKNVTSDMTKPYMITENNGHMFPTKAFDDEIQRQEHTLRHLRVMDAVAGYDDIAGATHWCMFDYNTHKDFGSGDRICYHGVMDMFRNPKMAASSFASQGDEEPFLEVGSNFDIGEHPAGNLGEIYIFSNADSVRMYKNDVLLKEYTKKDSPFKNLKHPPMLIDDFIGDAMKAEGFSIAQEQSVKDILNYSAIHGFNHLPPKILAKSAHMMARFHMNFEDAYRLYGKYIGNWGGKALSYKFEAIIDGKVVKTLVKAPVMEQHLKAITDHTELVEGKTYDVAAIRLQAVDQNDNVLPFYMGSAKVEVEGPAEIIGPDHLIFRGGMTGTYIRTRGEAGEVTVSIHTEWGEVEKLSYTVEIK